MKIKVDFEENIDIESKFKDAMNLANKMGCNIEFNNENIRCLCYPFSEKSTIEIGIDNYKKLQQLVGMSYNIEKDVRFVAETINTKNINELLEICKLPQNFFL